MQSDHEESDSRVNLHIKQSPHTSFLLYSPDTDVYHIALPLLREKNVIVQLRANKTDDRYLSLHHLRQSLDTDPTLKNISPPDRYKYIRMTFLCSDCDYVSSFFKHGKFAFLEIALCFAKFILYAIVDDNTAPESGRFLDCPPFDCQFCNAVSMCQSCTTGIEVLRSSILGFYRLMGCLYFRSGVKNKDLTSLTHFKKIKEQNSDLVSSDLQKTWVEFIDPKQ